MNKEKELQKYETNKFQKDLKLMKKRKKDFEKIKQVTTMLVKRLPLDVSNRDHPLIGNWKGSRECHIEPDWLLIYTIEDNKLILERTGSHSDLFGK